MTETLATAMGMAPAQVAVLGRQDLSTLSRGVTRVGAKQSTMLMAVGGLIYNTAPMGDWSGTAQTIDSWRGGTTAGSGGPANLPYGLTGTDTCVLAGRLQASMTGHAAADTFVAESNPGGRIGDYTYAVKFLSLCGAAIGSSASPITGLSWNPQAMIVRDPAHLSPFSTYTQTGDDWWVFTQCGRDATFTLTGLPSAADTITVGGTAYTWRAFADADLATEIAIGTSLEDNTVALAGVLATDVRIIVVAVDAAAGTVTIRSASNTNYTLSESTANGAWSNTNLSRAGVVGWSRIAKKLNDDTLVLDPRERHDPLPGQLIGDPIWNSQNVVGDVSGYIVPGSQSIFVAGCSYTAATKTLTAPSGSPFSGYTPGSDDSIQVLGGSNAVLGGTYSKVVSTNGSTTVVATDDITTDGLDGTLFNIIVWKPNAWRNASCTIANSTTVTLTGDITSTPLQGDLYIVYVTGGTGWVPTPQNNSEEAPTRSALTSKSSWWPYISFGKFASCALRTGGNFAAVMASDAGSLLNHYWSGTFTTAPRCFLSGDQLQILIGPIDSTYNGTPYCIEVMIAPWFDPERDFRMEASIGNSSRLDSRIVKFQTPPFTEPGIRPIFLRIIGSAGAIQTINTGSQDNYSQFWRFEAECGPTSASSNGPHIPGDSRFPAEPHIITQTALINPQVVNGSWNPSTNELTQTAAFSSASTPYARDVFIVTSGTGWQPGPYPVSARTNNKVTLTTGNGQPGAACSDVCGYYPYPTFSDFDGLETRWQVLMKAIHPSERGRFGYHGHYAGQAFSCTTGNGGTLLHHFGNKSFAAGTPSTYRLPMAPRWRCSSMRVDHFPGGGV